jgi:hypothetical protein
LSQEAEAPAQRRARLLALARAAQRQAEQATDLDVREQYLEIAIQWTLLADETAASTTVPTEKRESEH